MKNGTYPASETEPTGEILPSPFFIEQKPLRRARVKPLGLRLSIAFRRPVIGVYEVRDFAGIELPPVVKLGCGAVDVVVTVVAYAVLALVVVIACVACAAIGGWFWLKGK